MRLARRRKCVLFRRDPRRRRGAACVEFAMVAPVLLIVVLGIIDIGQFVNVGQVVINASREGARLAARQSTLNATEVETLVTTYLTNTYPNLPAADITVTCRDDLGGTIPGGDLRTIATGDAFSVEVDMEFQAVRWISGMSVLNNRSLNTTTVARRE